MTITALIWKELEGRRARLVLVAAAAGIANALALRIVNQVAKDPGTVSLWTFLTFALTLVGFFAAARSTSRRTNAAIESGLHSVKTRFIAKIEGAELAQIERIGLSEIRDRITENVTVISNAGSQVGSVLQSLSMFVFSLFYLAKLSLSAFVVLVLLQLVVVRLYARRRKLVSALLGRLAALRVQFLDRLADLLHGAKEIRLHDQRRREVLSDFNRTSAGLRDLSARTSQAFDDNILFVTVNLYVLLAIVVFVLPKHVTLASGTLPALVSSILFIWGSIQAGLSGYLSYVESNEALAEISRLEAKLDGAAPPAVAPAIQLSPWRGEAQRIVVHALEYEYPAAAGDASFHIGPVDLSIEPGEIVFIVGGNGAGKSTFLKALTGLYPLTRGTLECGGIAVNRDNVAAYRELISAIFSDFHLFSKVYGLLDVDPQVVQGLLGTMDLAHKTAFVDGRFTRRSLSTGQKKRLAMVVALLEDRPIFVLDEWAADQDPEFRRYFYEHLLPTLKQRGKTVIAVSHDDRYYACADRVVRLEYGRIRAIETLPPVPPESPLPPVRAA